MRENKRYHSETSYRQYSNNKNTTFVFHGNVEYIIFKKCRERSIKLIKRVNIIQN